jgi:hypothetical protein
MGSEWGEEIPQMESNFNTWHSLRLRLISTRCVIRPGDKSEPTLVTGELIEGGELDNGKFWLFGTNESRGIRIRQLISRIFGENVDDCFGIFERFGVHISGFCSYFQRLHKDADIVA